ncbi:MAG: serpin family protein [Isosphaeraceae bacterium]
MTRRKWLGIGVAALMVGCKARAGGDKEAGVNDLVAGDTAFGLDLYNQLRTGEGNRAIAPTSIATALAMAYAGARGDTAEQMGRVLRVGQSAAAYHEGRAALKAALAPPDGSSYQLRAADALWGQSGEPFRQDYLELVRKHYGAGLHPADFAGDAGGSADRINAWVAEQTRDKIRNLVGPGSITPLTRLVLTDALYFLGNWLRPFDDKFTHDGPFHLAGGTDATVRMMNQLGRFRLFEADDLQVLELPYKDNVLAMWIALPREADGLGKLEASLTPERLASWQAGLKDSRVQVTLPRFRMEVASGLVPALKGLGMTAPFHDREADFSGIGGRPHEYFLSDVLHKVFVDVNERGTEAAAATAVVVGVRSAAPTDPPKQFRADRPFLFLIRHNPTGAALFLGRVADPRG